MERGIARMVLRVRICPGLDERGDSIDVVALGGGTQLERQLRNDVLRPVDPCRGAVPGGGAVRPVVPAPSRLLQSRTSVRSTSPLTGSSSPLGRRVPGRTSRVIRTAPGRTFWTGRAKKKVPPPLREPAEKNRRRLDPARKRDYDSPDSLRHLRTTQRRAPRRDRGNGLRSVNTPARTTILGLYLLYSS